MRNLERHPFAPAAEAGSDERRIAPVRGFIAIADGREATLAMGSPSSAAMRMRTPRGRCSRLSR